MPAHAEVGQQKPRGQPASKSRYSTVPCHSRVSAKEQNPTREAIMVKPESVGMSAARLERLDQVMKHRYVDGGYLPGFITQIYRKGELAHTGIVGSVGIERGRPMQEDAIFRIYSMTKPITGVALMMAVEDGLVGLR